MKHFFQIISLLIIFLPLLTKGQEKQVNSLETKISVQIENGKIIDLFDEISQQTGIYFSYDPMLVDTQEAISLAIQNQSVQTILDSIFSNKFHFKLLKNQLVITKNVIDDRNGTQTKPATTTSLKVSGKLIDNETKEHIPYGSISILGKAFGTISNIDGEFGMKIPAEYKSDTLIISCMGYAQQIILLDTLQQKEFQIALNPVDIQLREVQVTAADPLKVMDNMISNIAKNYSESPNLMTSFYREVLKQDKQYVNVSEAIMNILKAPYTSTLREDQIRYLKGRKSPNVHPFQVVDFKMQGGPYYITKLDVIKTMDSFIDKEYRSFYEYKVDQIIQYLDRPTYVISFKPDGKYDYLTYEGKLFIDKETFALAHAEFSLSRNGKKSARKSLIRKKPKGFNVRPLDLDYQVTYKKNYGKWYLSSARTSVKFHVKSKHDKINSEFHSISDLLITDYRETNQRRFKHHEDFDSSDIFSDVITDYDEDFWGDYNVIKPSEDLRKALKKESKEESFDQTKAQPDHLTSQNVKK